MTKISSTSNDAPNLVTKLLSQPKVKRVLITAEHNRSRQFTMMKQINDFHNNTETLDLIELMDEISSGARKLFIQAKQAYNYKTGTSHLPTNTLSKGQINKRATYAKELAQHGLLKKVPCTGITNLDGIEYKHKANTYMISPYFIIPRYDDLSVKLHHLWSQL